MRVLVSGMIIAGVWLAGCTEQPSITSQPATRPNLEQCIPDNVAEVYIEGMACPFCTYNVEKKIREIADVQTVSTDLNTGVARVIFVQGAKPDSQALWGKVVKSGFTPKKITTATGVYRGE